MTNVTHDIVQKLWNLCNVLRDDGVTYHQYVTELTYLLFLKMMEETERESILPAGVAGGSRRSRRSAARSPRRSFGHAAESHRRGCAAFARDRAPEPPHWDLRGEEFGISRSRRHDLRRRVRPGKRRPG
jgi:hypothetical protein